jgi:hypothetical protein
MTQIQTKMLLLVLGMEGWACTTECKGQEKWKDNKNGTKDIDIQA